MPEQTPMMSQYLKMKEQCRDAVLFFRLGDFYEMFNEDALEMSRLLNLTLTSRAGYPMCGVPYHASRVYIARLLRMGRKVAVCEQVSLNAQGKGLAERKIVEVITPGTAVDDDYLEKNANNFLAAFWFDRGVSSKTPGMFALAFLDVTTGEFAATSFPEAGAVDRLRKELGQIRPSEILLQQSLFASHPDVAAVLDFWPSMVRNPYPDWSFNRETAYQRLCAAFSAVSLQAFSLTENSPEVPPAGILLDYLDRTAAAPMRHIDGIRIYGDSEFVSVDDATRKNLEIDRNLQDAGQEFTLFSIMNETRTSMGARTLRAWLLRPLVRRESIEARLDVTEQLYRRQDLLASVRSDLSAILDVERLSGRVSMEKANGKDLLALKQSMAAFLSLGKKLAEELPDIRFFPDEAQDCAEEVFSLIDASILEDCPVLLNEGGLIKDGWSGELDELRALRDNSNAVLEKYLAEEKERTGISNLKIKYNRLIGYYLEVSKGNLKSVPPHFIRRRSLANGDRFSTERLAELETELNGVHAGIIECEQRIFADVRNRVAARVHILLRLSQGIGRFDTLQAFAFAAVLRGWNKPEFTDSGELFIKEGRHPVVEAHFPAGEFVPNGIRLSSGEAPPAPEADEDGMSGLPSFALITGPNMAGKSTFLRQTALIVLMAQVGSFVPASFARITPVDKIFCRVGASDNLAHGESTFLVEMMETAHILRSATQSSLVIMDEVGRGTSTEDGLSIARAVTEYLLDHTGAKTLFATHYHELAQFYHPRMADFCLDVLETEGDVVFRKKVIPGISAGSYGVHVAKLAGLPDAVIRRAQTLLAEYETAHGVSASGGKKELLPPAASSGSLPSGQTPPSLFSAEELVLDEILSADPDNLTPMQALQLIGRWKSSLYPASPEH